MSGVVRGDAFAEARDDLRRALFLDRDGVINVNHGYVHRPVDTDWVPGIFDLCAVAHARGYALVVVTNQAGIARGLYSEDDFAAYTRWMHAEFAARGVPLLATYYCPHHPDAGIGGYRQACTCRKPEPGMIVRAADELGLDLAQSILIGDQPSDMQAAAAAGIGRRWLLGGQEIDTGVVRVRTLEEAAGLVSAMGD